MDRARDPLEEGHHPDRVAHRPQPAQGTISRDVVGHPVGLVGAAVESVAGVGRPDGAVATIDRDGCPSGIVQRHDDRRLAFDARSVPERVDDHLVLECDPIRPPMGDERATRQLDGGREERADHDRLAARVEPVDARRSSPVSGGRAFGRRRGSVPSPTGRRADRRSRSGRRAAVPAPRPSVATTSSFVTPTDRSRSMCSVHDAPMAPASTTGRPPKACRIGSIHQSSIGGP